MEYFWSSKMYNILYKKGNSILKIFGLLKGCFRRLWLLTKLRQYDYIFILREAAPIGLPFFEWVCARVLKKKMIYDFDDAIWIPQSSTSNSIAQIVKATWKVKLICQWAYKISVGNQYLYDYAARFNKNVVLNPTCVDTKRVHNIIKDQDNLDKKLVIGWTGSFSTLKFLDAIIEVLQELEKKYVFEFLVIADQNPKLPLKNFVYKEWNETSEIADLLECNIGVMPLDDNEYAKGKCGFKLIQYMALGIPVVASPVGVNKQIVDERINGFLCSSNESWIEALEKLLSDSALRQQMGEAGRKKIEQFYSVESNKDNFLSLFS